MKENDPLLVYSRTSGGLAGIKEALEADGYNGATTKTLQQAISIVEDYRRRELASLTCPAKHSEAHGRYCQTCGKDLFTELGG